MPQSNTRKVAVVGAGEVGAGIARVCLGRGVVGQVSIYDKDRELAEAQAMDLRVGLQTNSPGDVEGSDDFAICSGAAVVVIAAGAAQKSDQTRLELLQPNAAMLRELMPRLLSAAPDAIYLMVSQPVDALTWAALKLSALPAGRVIGSGTVLESARFRLLIAQRCRVSVENVHGYIAGEQGEGAVPLWSTAAIAGIPLHEWAVPHHGKLTVRDRTEIFQTVKTDMRRAIDGKGAANFGAAMAVTDIIQAIVNDENRVLPVSGPVEGFAGISDVCLSLPRILGAGGAEGPLPIGLSANEQAGLAHSAEQIQATIRSAGL